MTDCKKLNDAISASGITKTAIARKMKLSRAGLYKKLCNKSEFKQSEMEKLSKILRLSQKQEREIFFASDVV